MPGRKANMRASGMSTKMEHESTQENFLVDPYRPISDPETICSQEDHSRRKNCAKNPWCLFGLGEQKDGIWKNEAILLDIAGPDPSLHLREYDSSGVLSPPAGLKNLGATCYLNVLMQSLYHNLLVRDAVFNLVTSDTTVTSNDSAGKEMIPVMRQLQNAFTHMQCGHNGVVDICPFVELLGLDKTQQQDPQEFNKLFLAKIESANLGVRGACGAAAAANSLHEVLSGAVKYSTECSGCNTERTQQHDFHELDLSIEGCNALEEALDGYSRVELLDGDNMYDCSTCNRRQIARRCTQIVKAPTVLCLHLLRYHYDRKTYERKKLKTELTFPDSLQIGSDNYKLVSVLFHKGQSAYGGHYVCDVLHWETGEWWHIDDDTVTRTINPSFFNSSSSKSKNKTSINTSKTAATRDKGNASPGDSKTSEDDNELLSEDSDEEYNESKKKNRKPASALKKYGRKANQGSTAGNNGHHDSRSRTVTATITTTTTSAVKNNSKSELATAAAAAAIDLTDDAEGEGERGNGSTCVTASNGETSRISSAGNVNRKRDAYMLSYVKVGLFEASCNQPRCEPDKELVEAVSNRSTRFHKEIEDYKSFTSTLRSEVQTRKSIYNELKHSLVPRSNSSSSSSSISSNGSNSCQNSFVLVPTEWFKRWVIGDPSTFLRDPINCRRTNCIAGEVSANSTSSSSSSSSSSKSKTDIDKGSVESRPVEDSSPVQCIYQKKEEEEEEEADRRAKSLDAASDNGVLVANNGIHQGAERNIKHKETADEELSLLGETFAFDTTPYCCEHGQGLRPSTAECFKVISDTAYQAIKANTRANKTMTFEFEEKNFRCSICYDALVEQRKAIHSETTVNQHILELVEASKCALPMKRGTYWLSKAWLNNFKRYTQQLQQDPRKAKKRKSSETMKGFTTAEEPTGSATSKPAHEIDADGVIVIDGDLLEPSSTAGAIATSATSTATAAADTKCLDQEVNSVLFCKHGRPALKFQTRAITIDAQAWKSVLKAFPSAREIMGSDMVCSECQQEKASEEEAESMNREYRKTEVQSYPQLLALLKRKRIYPPQFEDVGFLQEPLMDDPETHFQAIDGEWLAHWRAYLGDTSCPRPPPLTNRRLRCFCTNGGKPSNDSSQNMKADGGDEKHSSSDTTVDIQSAESHDGRILLPDALRLLEEGIDPNLHDIDSVLVAKFEWPPVAPGKDSSSGALASAVTSTSSSSSEEEVANNCICRNIIPKAELISADQWMALVELYGARTCTSTTSSTGSSHAIPNAYEARQDDASPTGQSEESPLFEVTLRCMDGKNGRKTPWTWLPKICQRCVEACELQRQKALSEYTNATITVCHYRSEEEFLKDVPSSSSAASTAINTGIALGGAAGTLSGGSSQQQEGGGGIGLGSGTGSGRPLRSSGRSTRGRKVTCSLNVDSSDTISLVKLKIWQSMTQVEIFPEKQRLFDSNRQVLLSGIMTLSQCNIKAGSTIFVLERVGLMEPGEYEGFQDCFMAHHSTTAAGASDANGFGGTLLLNSTAAASAPTATGTAMTTSNAATAAAATTTVAAAAAATTTVAAAAAACTATTATTDRSSAAVGSGPDDGSSPGFLSKRGRARMDRPSRKKENEYEDEQFKKDMELALELSRESSASASASADHDQHQQQQQQHDPATKRTRR